MSEPTKFLPDESIIQEWAAEHAKGSMHPFDALAAEILRLRAELAKASAEVQRLNGPRVLCDKDGKPIVCDAPPPKFTPKQIAECMTDAPPADVLGESLRGRLCAAMLDERVSPSIYGAVHELAQVVERIARAQRGGK